MSLDHAGRAVPVVAYVGLLWLFKGWQFAAISTVVGVAMIAAFSAWHRSAPDSLDRFPTGLQVVREPGGFVGGAVGGAVFAALALVALLLGASLMMGRRQGQAGSLGAE